MGRDWVLMMQSSMNRWLTPADAAAAVLKALAIERAIQARCEETISIVRDEPWKIGGVDAQEAAFVRAMDDRAASIERAQAAYEQVLAAVMEAEEALMSSAAMLDEQLPLPFSLRDVRAVPISLGIDRVIVR